MTRLAECEEHIDTAVKLGCCDEKWAKDVKRARGIRERNAAIDPETTLADLPTKTVLELGKKKNKPYLGDALKYIEERGGNVTEKEAKEFFNQCRRSGSNKAPHPGSCGIRRGDFREVLQDLPPGSVDLILTDPPYAEEALPLYEALGEFAARVLKPGGSLICYTGQSTIFKAHALLEKHLRYWWLLSLTHSSGGQKMPGKWVIIEWKPILWFVKESRRDNNFLIDRIQGTPPRKKLHDWAQGVEEVTPIIETLTSPGDLIVDPFAGSGSFGVMAEKLGRRFIGADLNV
jgi:site-specific DNA-methyltransferase (adenine-specific)